MHNAEYLGGYPNLPAWLSRSQIYGAWCGITAVGLVGYTLYRRGRAFIGLWLLVLYASLGFDGLLHYRRAPLAAHTVAMNLTIWSEVAAAALALVAVVTVAARGSDATHAEANARSDSVCVDMGSNPRSTEAWASPDRSFSLTGFSVNSGRPTRHSSASSAGSNLSLFGARRRAGRSNAISTILHRSCRATVPTHLRSDGTWATGERGVCCNS
mgnify:CR=1 FL=1